MSREDFKNIVSFILNFTITAGGTLIGAMLEAGSSQMPKQGVILLALIVGGVQASLQAKAVLEGRPPESVHDTVRQLVMQMKNIQTIQAVTTPPEIKEVLNAPPIKNVSTSRNAGTDV